MTGTIGSGWQTTMADLALILFLVVSAAGVPKGPISAPSGTGSSRDSRPSLETVPSTAVYRTTAGTTLPQWLAMQTIDDRQIVTVIVRRAAGGRAPAMEQGIAFLDQIEASGRHGRLLVEPDVRNEVLVVLAYDRANASGMALAGS